MNFVKQVEEQLRDLGTESRRKHPGVKEAAERAILSLRSLQNKYVVAVRRATSANSKESHPTTAIFQSQDVLRPFLLAANYPDVGNKVLNLSIDGIQTLLAGKAICKNDGVNVVRVLNIQAALCAKAIKVKSGFGYGTAAGAIGNMIPSAGSVVNAGVGTISSLGNSILSGFGFKSERTLLQEEEDGSGGGNDNATESSSIHSARSVARASHSSHRSLKEDEALSIRILQTLTMIVDSDDLELSEEVLSQCIATCLVLHECGARSSPSEGHGPSNNEIISASQTKGHKIRSNSGGPSRGGSQRQLQVQGKGGSHGGTGAQTVSGAAAATLRQIISTLFARAAENAGTEDLVEDQVEEENQNAERVCLQTLASKTLLDLCNLVEGKECAGPFGQALIGQQHIMQRPSQTICFNLMEMVVEQHVDLFTAAKCDFHYILKDTICPLVTKMLAACWKEDTAISQGTAGAGPLDLILKLSSMTTSIVTRYGRIPSLKMQCFDILMALFKPVKSATNLLRDSHEFEDGYVYNADARVDMKVKHDLPERQQGSKYESSRTMWAAAISLEVIYTLISTHFHDLMPLFSTKGRSKHSETLLSTMISVVCDFAVVASSSKSSISKVVEAAGGDGESSDEGIDDNDASKTKAAPKIEDRDNVFTCDDNFDIERILGVNHFDIERIHPKLISTAKSMTEYDIGGAVWTALNCVLILWKGFQPKNDNEEVQVTLVDECFGPSLAVIQHFLRRCPASTIICKSTFSGYRYMSKSVLPLTRGSNFKREVVLASLCKLTLPSWGKEESREFRSINVMAVALLFQILNFNGDDICEDWLVVVTCISQLSQLTTTGTAEEKIIASNLSRLGKYSTTLGTESLKHLVSSLIKLSSSSEVRLSGGNNKMFGSLLFHSIRKSLQSTKVSTSPNDYESIPFALVALLAVSLDNSERFDSFADDVMRHFSDQASESESDVVRTFSFDVISHMITSTLVSGNSKSRKTLLEPLCRSIETTQNVDAAGLGLTKLKQIIEDGYNLTAAWSTIISALTAIAECVPNSRIGDWGGCCTIAFGCLKLIVDDFLNELPDLESTRIALLDCCASFGSSRYDVNTSLTATGMLWSIADQDSSPSSVDHVLAKLAFLASDDRVEVRNCVVNTLFSCVVGLGQNFTAAQWEGIFSRTIFAVLNQVKDQGTATDGNDDKHFVQENKSVDRYKVSVHHSRDSASKQWATTQVLTLRGIERVLRLFFDVLLETAQEYDNNYNQESNWFEKAWHLIVDQCLSCSTLLGGRETLDLRLVGVELLVICCQTSSKTGFIAADVRVGTNMQVVNGALRSVRSIDLPKESLDRGSKSAEDEICDPVLAEKRRQLFEKSFASLMQFDSFLRNGEKDASGEDSGYVDSTALQILTKLGNGLVQLYECCKENELSPCLLDDAAEKSFVDLVTLIIRIASGGSNSKFLTQAQRPCLDLLKTMSMNCSSRAFEVLTQLGSKAIFQQGQDKGDVDIVQVEAGKLISEICSSEDVTVVVTKTIRGLTATIDLPGVIREEKDSIHTVHEEGGKEEVLDDDFGGVIENGLRHVFDEEEEHSLEPSTQEEEDDSFDEEEDLENCQLKQINAGLMREVEKLRSQKERLEQQVAVLSEGSAYT